MHYHISRELRWRTFAVRVEGVVLVENSKVTEEGIDYHQRVRLKIYCADRLSGDY